MPKIIHLRLKYATPLVGKFLQRVVGIEMRLADKVWGRLLLFRVY
jgi:hypothetical protein